MISVLLTSMRCISVTASHGSGCKKQTDETLPWCKKNYLYSDFDPAVGVHWEEEQGSH